MTSVDFEGDWGDVSPKPLPPPKPETQNLECDRCQERIRVPEKPLETKWDRRHGSDGARLHLDDGRVFHQACFHKMTHDRGPRSYVGKFFDAHCPDCKHWHQGDRAVVFTANDHTYCARCEPKCRSTPVRVDP